MYTFVLTSKNLYIIAGCNGAGKTTASFTILGIIFQQMSFADVISWDYPISLTCIKKW